MKKLILVLLASQLTVAIANGETLANNESIYGVIKIVEDSIPASMTAEPNDIYRHKFSGEDTDARSCKGQIDYHRIIDGNIKIDVKVDEWGSGLPWTHKAYEFTGQKKKMEPYWYTINKKSGMSDGNYSIVIEVRDSLLDDEPLPASFQIDIADNEIQGLHLTNEYGNKLNCLKVDKE